MRLSIGAAQTGAAVNLLLAAVKVGAGVFGHTYALAADGVESLADVVSSLFVWGGISVDATPAADERLDLTHAALATQVPRI